MTGAAACTCRRADPHRWLLQFIGLPECKVVEVPTRPADREGWCSLLAALLGALQAINTAAAEAGTAEGRYLLSCVCAGSWCA